MLISMIIIDDGTRYICRMLPRR